jgi:copper chaperone CopZ
MTTVVYAVDGMCCDHCVHAISDEVLKIADVEQVSVDLLASTVAVSGQPVDDAAVRAAIAQAGYTVLG